MEKHLLMPSRLSKVGPGSKGVLFRKARMRPCIHIPTSLDGDKVLDARHGTTCQEAVLFSLEEKGLWGDL